MFEKWYLFMLIYCMYVLNYQVHRNWRNRLHAASVNALESYCIQVKTCVEMALTCVEVDRHKRPTIGNILNKLNETETASQFPDALLKDPGSTKNQVRSLTAQLCFTMIIFLPR